MRATLPAIALTTAIMLGWAAAAPAQGIVGDSYRAIGTAAPAGDNVTGPPPESPDPDIGWHQDGPWRVCTNDCDDPEAPGSGYTCRDVTIMGMPFRDCVE